MGINMFKLKLHEKLNNINFIFTHALKYPINADFKQEYSSVDIKRIIAMYTRTSMYLSRVGVKSCVANVHYKQHA